MKFTTIFTLLSTTGVTIAAPMLSEPSTKLAARGSDSANLVISNIRSGDDGVQKRGTDAADVGVLRAVYVSEDKVKRGSDADNLVLRTVYVSDDKEKRGTDAADVGVLRTVYVSDDKEKRGTDADNLVIRTVYVSDDKEKRGTDAADVGVLRAVYVSDDKANKVRAEKRKFINPYTDDIDAADAHTVLGE